MDQLMSLDTMSNDKYLSCFCINTCEDKYIFMTLQREKHTEQSQLDITFFKNHLLNKPQPAVLAPSEPPQAWEVGDSPLLLPAAMTAVAPTQEHHSHVCRARG